MGFLKSFFSPSLESENDAWKMGYKQGEEVGIRKGLAMNFERSQELDEKEYNEIMKFLISRGVELCCYDDQNGGLRCMVRKRDYGNH